MNPKQNLTKLSTAFKLVADQPQKFASAAKAKSAAKALGHAFTAETYRFAAAVGESGDFNAELLQDLHSHSITTAEELASLTMVKSAKVSAGLKKLGISQSMCDRLVKAIKETEEGKEQISEWERFQSYDYATGFDLDPDAEPETPEPGAAMGAGAGGAAGAPAPAGPGEAGPSNLTSLIDSFMGRIRNQQSRGTCVAFTTAACLEYYQNRFCQQLLIDLSEQFIYWDMVDQTKQHNLMSCFPLIKKFGACREITWPYYPSEMTGNDGQGPAPAAALKEAPAYRCKQVLQIAARDVQAIKHHISQARVVGIGIPVYASWFESPVVRQYGNITVPLAGEVPEKIGHAVALVGFEDNEDFAGGGYFIVRNSWGQLWATQSTLGAGYGTIPYRYIEKFNWDAWCIRS